MFGHGTIQRYVFMLSTRLIRTSGNGLSRKMWSRFLFPQHLEASYDEHACETTIFFSLCWKLKNQSLKLIVITFFKKRPSSDRVIKWGSGNLSGSISVAGNRPLYKTTVQF